MKALLMASPVSIDEFNDAGTDYYAEEAEGIDGAVTIFAGDGVPLFFNATNLSLCESFIRKLKETANELDGYIKWLDRFKGDADDVRVSVGRNGKSEVKVEFYALPLDDEDMVVDDWDSRSDITIPYPSEKNTDIVSVLDGAYNAFSDALDEVQEEYRDSKDTQAYMEWLAVRSRYW